MAYEFNRNQRDKNYETSLTIDGTNGASVSSGVFDLEQVVGGDIEEIVFEITVPAVPGNTNTAESIDFAVQDSADNSSFAAVSPAIAFSVAGVTSTGSAATSRRFRLPPGARRYVKVVQTETGDGFTDANEVAYFRILF
jgi:hypothetical protein